MEHENDIAFVEFTFAEFPGGVLEDDGGGGGSVVDDGDFIDGVGVNKMFN